jgi:hypothetical protein
MIVLRRKNLGGTIGCAPFDNQMDVLKQVYQQVLLAGVPSSDTKMKSAAAFIERETGLSSVWIAGPAVCANLMAEADTHIKTLNAKLSEAMQVAYQTPPAKPDLDAGDKILSAVKWGAAAVAVVGVIYLVGPLVRGISKGAARRITA